uniref:Uncharacterized protein n=1 Tax=Chlamydomonas euryale TaxID=1486919 RepID=A0A6U2ETZ3_9CHLO
MFGGESLPTRALTATMHAESAAPGTPGRRHALKAIEPLLIETRALKASLSAVMRQSPGKLLESKDQADLSRLGHLVNELKDYCDALIANHGEDYSVAKRLSLLHGDLNKWLGTVMAAQKDWQAKASQKPVEQAVADATLQTAGPECQQPSGGDTSAAGLDSPSAEIASSTLPGPSVHMLKQSSSSRQGSFGGEWRSSHEAAVEARRQQLEAMEAKAAKLAASLRSASAAHPVADSHGSMPSTPVHAQGRAAFLGSSSTGHVPSQAMTLQELAAQMNQRSLQSQASDGSGHHVAAHTGRATMQPATQHLTGAPMQSMHMLGSPHGHVQATQRMYEQPVQGEPQLAPAFSAGGTSLGAASGTSSDLKRKPQSSFGRLKNMFNKF